MADYIDIVFDGPPSHESGRFVEVENPDGHSIGIGEWIETPPFWRLRIPTPDADLLEALEAIVLVEETAVELNWRHAKVMADKARAAIQKARE